MTDSHIKPMCKICYDRIVPDDLLQSKIAVNRGIVDLKNLCKTDFRSHRMAVAKDKRWEHKIINCSFLDGSPSMRQRVKEITEIWSEHCSIRFRFVDDRNDSQIRISFFADSGSWSAVGTDALIESYFPKYQPTMNFGWLRDGTADNEWLRVVLHEFGHALGCIHEHASLNFGRKWNKEAVYEYFSGPPNFWSDEQIEHNVLYQYSKEAVDATSFDPESIMIYEFDGSLFSDNLGPTNSNTKLSALDIEMIQKIYPA